MKLFVISMRYALAVCLLASSITGSIAARPSKSVSTNWPQWRGPSSPGISAEKGVPDEWSEKKNVAWKTPIAGRGHSSPIVWGNRIFLTTSIEGEVVPDHKPYKHMLGGREFTHPDWAGSDHSYSFRLISVDANKGKVLWERTAYEGP